MPNFISEDDIEQALLKRLVRLHGFNVLNCHTAEAEDLNDGSGRTDKRQVILADRARAAAVRLNPGIPETAIDDAMAMLLEKRQAMSLVAANQAMDDMIRNGIRVEFDDAKGRKEEGRVQLIDFANGKTAEGRPNNEFLAATQLWIRGVKFRRPDVILYVNGLPLVFIELKNSNVAVRDAFDVNLTTYKAEIPQLFHCNAFCILSNAIETRVGSITSEWEHFFTWLRVEDEKEKVDRQEIAAKGTSLEFVTAGLCHPEKLLDYVENFTLFYKDTQKIIAQNHQFIGVNNAFDIFQRREEMKGKLGVFWHTQGSGKSYSMIFYSRKIMRKLTGNFTFVVVTDREDLDRQIYRNFLHTGTVGANDAVQPKDSEEMRKFLGQNKRLVFTLIHKFRWDKGSEYPLLSDRSDIVVIVDEAHRTQYKSLAENMRVGLPKAQYLAFTGTPLLGSKRKTNEWFGDYVSEYTFQQSMEDGATVRLVYEKRVPDMHNQNEDLSEEFYEILEDENLDDVQQAKLEKKFATELEVIKRPDRLDAIAKDIVFHFPHRGYLGKAMVICLDKFTAVEMYDRVKRLWTEQIKALVGQIGKAKDSGEKARLKAIREYMQSVEMAVIVSEEAGEEVKFAKKKLDIKPHRERLKTLDEHGHDAEYNFKDPQHPLQLVFVCAMWLTGFDAPTVSTLYLDKPQKDHTLMQTIARANRQTSWKINGKSKSQGEVVDYYNIFRRMKKALKDYAQGQKGTQEAPVVDKEELYRLLHDAIEQASVYCASIGVDLVPLRNFGDVFKNVEAFVTCANTLLTKDEWRKSFFVYENTITSLYEACKPDIVGKPVVRSVALFQYLRGVVESIIEQADTDKVCQRIGELLDQSVVVADSPTSAVQDMPEPKTTFSIVARSKTWDLSNIDFEKLREDFKEAPYKNIEIADLRAFIDKKLEQMLNVNVTRMDFAQRLQQIIDDYNAGGSANDNYFDELLRYTRDIQAETERHVREGLTEDELELFDLLKKDKMTKKEEAKVKLAAKTLLHRLRDETPKVLIEGWFKDSQTIQVVKDEVEKVLDSNLPDSYDRTLFIQKRDKVLEVIIDYASQGRKWAA